MTKPLLSVCVITYNHKRYIGQALDSILAQQTDFEWRLIVADDFSTDGTREILQRYKQQYPDKVHLILQKQNVGPETNWLDLMAFPKTKYVAYAEGDDYYTDPLKLQKQVDYLEAHDDFAICFHPVKVTYEDGSRPDESFPSLEQRRGRDVLELKDLLQENFIQTNSALYRWRYTRQDIRDVYPRGVAPGDWFMHLLHAEKGKIGFIDEVMAVYRRHPAGLWWIKGQDQDSFWRKNGLEHLALYEVLLEKHGTKEELRTIIYEAAVRAFVALARVPVTAKDDILGKAMGLYPLMAAEVFRRYNATQAKSIEDHRQLVASHEAHIGKLNDLIHERSSFDEVVKENKTIKASKTYKMALKLAHTGNGLKRGLLGKRKD